MIEIYINKKPFNRILACNWLIENNIKYQYKIKHTECAFGIGSIVGWSFFFYCEEDAIIFKLKWI